MEELIRISLNSRILRTSGLQLMGDQAGTVKVSHLLGVLDVGVSYTEVQWLTIRICIAHCI